MFLGRHSGKGAVVVGRGIPAVQLQEPTRSVLSFRQVWQKDQMREGWASSKVDSVRLPVEVEVAAE